MPRIIGAGRAAIDAYWQRIGQAKRWLLDVHSTEGGGGLVVQRGTSRLERDAGGALRTSVVEFVLTWRQQDDGSWRILSDVYWQVR